MLLTVTSAGWRLPGVEDTFELTRALRPHSHLELHWFEGPAGETLTEVWVDLYVTESDPVRKLMMYRMDAQDLEWRFTFEGPYDPLVIELTWNGVDEEAGEITLRNVGVPRDLLDEIGAPSAV
jgi:hypothetical protein